MQVSEALGNVDALSGQTVTVEGVFVLVRDIAYVVPTEDDVDRLDLAIEVEVADLKRILLSRVPALGGSQYSYCDEARITGLLSSKLASDFPCVVKDVERLEIFKHGEWFEAIP